MSRSIPPTAGLLALAFASGCSARTMTGLESWQVTSMLTTDGTTIAMPARTQIHGCAITYSIDLQEQTPRTALLEYHYDYDCLDPAWSGDTTSAIEVELHHLESGLQISGVDVDWQCDAIPTSCTRPDGSRLILERT